MTDYEPGKCNIGSQEQRKRFFLGSAGFVTAGVYTILEYFGGFLTQSSLLLFVLLFIGFNGFIQGQLKFCAGYGILSKQNVSENSQPDNISRNKKDILESLRIQLYSLFGAVLVTALVNLFVL